MCGQQLDPKSESKSKTVTESLSDFYEWNERWSGGDNAEWIEQRMCLINIADYILCVIN